VVRFHPSQPSLLASGSLDHEVFLWDAVSGHSLRRHTFGKPIASLAFHASADVLAIACGHKLYMWQYSGHTSPVIVLRTRRSMRAVHFHPHGLPLVLTAEVQDPSPTPELLETLTENGPFGKRSWNEVNGDAASGKQSDWNVGIGGKPTSKAHQTSQSSDFMPSAPVTAPSTSSRQVPSSPLADWASASSLPPAMVRVGWEVPFPASLPPSTPDNAGGFATRLAATYNASVWNILGEEQPPRVRLRLFDFDVSKPSAELDEERGVRLRVSDAVLCSEMGVHFSPCGRFLAATLACRAPMPGNAVDVAAAAVAAAGGGTAAQLSPDAFNAAPQRAGSAPEPMEWEGEDANGRALATPSLRSERVVFEVRVLCVDGPKFGDAVKAVRIRAAHCLTSVQFSPSGDHILLAYGKKHSSLLRSLVAEGRALVPLHTILEVLRVETMHVVGVLPSAEDEINAACFHPIPGGGMAYGTKEGRLRLVTSDRSSERDIANSGGAGETGPRPSLRELRDLQDLVLMQQSWLQQQEARERNQQRR
jgi:activating molecule in BECN1-regulated autophagy protein 1